ncbi:MAG TPA: hypothetical protein VMZ27_12770 [Candidatus Saccharimonadales bacterium]|nr:hypothetical protein [Candidatus Saccharimonadales bacterium]
MPDTTQNSNTLTNPNSEKTARPIGEFAGQDDYPACAVGELVDIGGFTGVVYEIVGNSLKVRTSEGVNRSFNYHTLKKLYGPRRLDPDPIFKEEEPEAATAASAPETREIPEPNFDQEPVAISGLILDPGFPMCSLGKMVEINGYVGVVVEITGLSLKVRSPNGTSRKYNADVLRKLHGKGS